MPSMLEVMREYKNLTAKKRAEGSLPAQLEERLVELELVVKASRKSEASRPAAETTPAMTVVAPSVTQASALPPRASRPPAVARGSAAAWPAVSASPVKAPPPAARPAAPAPIPRTAPRPVPSDGAAPALLPAPAVTAPPALLDEVPPMVRAELGLLDRVSDRLPKTRSRRLGLIMLAVALLIAIDCALVVAFGLPKEQVFASLLPALLLIGGVGWGLVYPGLLFWRERAADNSQAHKSEADFEAHAPYVEPVVAALTALGVVLWVWLGGLTSEGIATVAGTLFGLGIGIAAVALGAVLAIRPTGAKKAKARALRQYVEGGIFHLSRGNFKRARRLLERAVEEAGASPQAQEIQRQLRLAALQEADELRKKGFSTKADELMRAQGLRLGAVPSGASPFAESASEEPKPRIDPARTDGAPEPFGPGEVGLGPPSTPRLLSPGELTIDNGRGAKPAPVGEEAAIHERARSLERKGRAREALELLVEHRLAVSAATAQEAAKEYISQGLLRSADMVYSALGERQIPEFYLAVAGEWARETGGDPPPEACVRLARIVAELGQPESGARVACRGALSSLGTPEAKKEATDLALELCKAIGKEPPVELLEAMGKNLEGAAVYEAEGRTLDALRLYCRAADEIIEKRESRAKLIPVLSKIFLADPQIADKYLDPLTDHVLATVASGPQAMKILVAARKRRKNDDRLGPRLFQLFLDAGQAEDAFAELEAIGKTAADSESVTREYAAFLGKFPDHLKARGQSIRALLKAGRVDQAAAQMHAYLARAREDGDAKETMSLIELLLDWGHEDKELRKYLGMLRIKTSGAGPGAPRTTPDRADERMAEQGLIDLEHYVREGGRDPAALGIAKTMLGENLVLPSGAPNHERMVRLGRFLIHAGDARAAISHLEVARASKEQKGEAQLLLARAHVALGSTKKAIALLRETIAGRPVPETLNLHYELARALDAQGAKIEADRIDRSIAAADPDFAGEYEKGRGRADSADTAWGNEEPPTEHTNPNDVTEPTDQHGRAVSTSEDRERRILPVESPVDEDPAEASLDLASALLPRYRLGTKLGSGGMGEVHLAEDVDLRRKVAIKVLRRTLATDLFLAKFKEEAQIVAQLAHPNIVSIFDLGQRASWSYIVMEYVDGPDLASLVNAHGGGFERWRLLRIVATVADAMEYAHSRGVIHRDLKPANILVGPNDVAKVTDFGIAKILQPDGAQGETAFSAAGLQVGTVNYMAPEQIAGRAVDARTDLYLLGTTLYVCLTGAFPFRGEGVAFQKLRDDPTPLRSIVPTISAELEACVMRCLSRRVDLRYQTMTEFAEALRRVPEGRASKSTRG